MEEKSCFHCVFSTEIGKCECETSDFYDDYVDIKFVCDKYKKIE